ncbi:grasp-with-spasm system ATP-grasp peptide maturase [Sphingobacterium deserti]|uniref:ATP-grasp fold domain-containing protein n=1 Tax=Sphingobacterium deserti TaxID=1229276 RepID=A0A0B8SYZ7_9SPHI|nr:grasp-with-spasm system ATP-grasp peptide maturase [Sphingobacterium deserti]KGE12742.1 ATP-grasp fold domain-containing protein [Sphingobacterium deserti]
MKVLIISQNFDVTTDLVIKWLIRFNIKFLRLNLGDVVTVKRMEIRNEGFDFVIDKNGVEINSNEILSVWYRKGNIFFENVFESVLQTTSWNKEDESYIIQIKKFLKGEMSTLTEFFYDLVENRYRSIGKRSNSRNNKLIHLMHANNCGFFIPDTFIETSKKRVTKYLNSNHVTKAIRDGIFLQNDGGYVRYVMYTQLLENISSLTLSEDFFPSLIQPKINKKYELRVFYLKGKIFSMAIFSQDSTKTKVDFRRYDHQNPNRCVPYKLKHDDEIKIRNFMTLSNLNTGSLDFIVSSCGKLYFLEVNPVGQFGMVSYPCNYFIEREIAKELSLIY